VCVDVGVGQVCMFIVRAVGEYVCMMCSVARQQIH